MPFQPSTPSFDSLVAMAQQCSGCTWCKKSFQLYSRLCETLMLVGTGLCEWKQYSSYLEFYNEAGTPPLS